MHKLYFTPLKKSWQAVEPINQPNDIVQTEQRNAYWRDAANYKTDVLPLFLRLENVDWEKALTWHKAHWQREFLSQLRFYFEEDKGRWRGRFYNPKTGRDRLIQRDRLLVTSQYRLRLALPIPTPAELAQRQYDKALARWRRVYANIDARERAAALDQRKYLADRLRVISRTLGHYNTRHYAGPGAQLTTSTTWELSASLKAVLEPESRNLISRMEPDSLGEIRAKVEHFWECWQDFHKAEQTAVLVTPPIPTPPTPPQNATQNSEVLRSLLADIHQHFPGILSWPFVPYPLEFVLPGLACYVGEVWASPRQHSAPQDFDRAYYNQSPAGRRDFLAALRRVYDALTKELSSDPFGSQLFATMSWKETNEAPAQSKEVMHALAQRGAAWLGGWLNWRDLSSADQLLTALDTVGIANHNLRLTVAEPERPPRLYVPDCAPEDEGPRFAALLREFERALPGKKSDRRNLLRRLERLRTLPLALLRDGPPYTLPARFSALHWPGLLERPAESEVLETFWPDLEQALRTRIEWAGRAYSIVAGTLPAPAPQPLDTPVSNATAPADVWAGLLRTGIEFSLPDLDRLLVNVGLLNDAASRTPTPDFKGSAVVGVVSALRERRYLLSGNNAKLAEVLAERYGRDVAKPHTVGRNYEPLPNSARQVYTRALAFLPKP